MKKSLSEYDWKEEMEKIHEILQNRLNSLLGVKEPQISRPDESEYLFQRKQGTKDMLVFHITEQKLTTRQLDFVIPNAPGFCHIKNELYLAGGQDLASSPSDYFRKISVLGKAEKLKSLPTKKASFPMTHWEKQNIIITLGGQARYDQCLDEVQQFIIPKNEWKTLPSLPESIYGSSATVLNGVLYNIGGVYSKNSVCWFDLLSQKGKWNAVKTLATADFRGQCWKDATVLRNKIVHFGSFRDQNTYVLEQKGEEGNLEVKSRFKGIQYKRGWNNSSFCTYKDKIYFFHEDKYAEVWCFDLETEQSSIFF